jgi:hypothetical protein
VVSVGTHTKGRKLDSYTVRRIAGHEMLLDPDLLKLPVELTITPGGIFPEISSEWAAPRLQ